METLFLLKDPATLARFDLLRHATNMMSAIDTQQAKLNQKGIKLTVTAYCEPNVEGSSGKLWKTLRFAVRLLHAHRLKTHLNISLVVDEVKDVTTFTYGNGTTMTFDNQHGHDSVFLEIAERIVFLLRDTN